MTRFLFAIVFCAVAISPVAAQPNPFEKGPKKRATFADVGKVTVEVTPKEAKPGETVQVKLTVAPNPGNWTYPVNPKDREQAGSNRIKWEPKLADLIFVGGITDPPDPKSKPRDDDKPNGPKDEYYPHRAEWIFAAVVSPKASPGLKKVPLGSAP